MILTIISSFLFFIALLCLGTTLVIHCRGFYHLLAEPLQIISESGLAKEVVLRNYDHLIEYCSPFYRGVLSFPDFPSSSSALSHFAETKTLFSCLSLAVPLCCLAGGFLLAIKTWWNHKITGLFILGHKALQTHQTSGQGEQNNLSRTLPAEFSRALRFTAWLCILVPFVCLLLFLTNFHKVFYGMHHILFDNNNWIFDAATDPVITILPERYFLCCGIGIILFLLLAAAALSRLRSYLFRPDRSGVKQKNVFSVHS
ncbi:MAG: DUF1461 domain-containing protein [Lachnospiraceae bacterium]|nr:DUF1461 domain-containing protein [Lachnospiraceae bacterium]